MRVLELLLFVGGFIAMGAIMYITGCYILDAGGVRTRHIQRKADQAAEKRKQEWARAVMNARWESYWVTEGDTTRVGIARVARTAEQQETLRVEPPISEFPACDPMWEIHRKLGMDEAQLRVDSLNEELDARRHS